MVTGILGIGTCIGIYFTIFGFTTLIYNLLNKVIFSFSNSVSPQWYDRCFAGEGERILKSREKNKSDVYENFPLPIFKQASDLNGEARKEAKECLDKIAWQSRRIEY